MRLHPITRLILFALVLRLCANAALVGASIDFLNTTRFDYHGVVADFFLKSMGRHFEDIAQSLAHILTAVSVEGGARIWAALKDGRLDFIVGHPVKGQPL